MAWEMQRHMVPYIEPSLWKYIDSLKTEEAQRELIVGLWVDQNTPDFPTEEDIEEARQTIEDVSNQALVRDIAEHAAKVKTTTKTNGAWKFYCVETSHGYYSSFEWCTDEELQEYYS